jgi:N-acetylneuraminate synthase
MAREIKFGNRKMGDGHPAYVIAEVGINHNGDLMSQRRLLMLLLTPARMR